MALAFKHPDRIRNLVAVSLNLRPDAIYPEMRAQQGQVNAAAAEFMRDTPMYQLNERVAPRPQDFGRLLDKIGDLMSKDYDFSEQVRALRVPTLIVAADADMAPPSHHSPRRSSSRSPSTSSMGSVARTERAAIRRHFQESLLEAAHRRRYSSAVMRRAV